MNNDAGKELAVGVSDGLTDLVAVVTGASSGIGRAIAVALSRHGAQLCLIGRNATALASTVAALDKPSCAKSFPIDLLDSQNFASVSRYLGEHSNRLDILVHCAGVIHHGTMERGRIEDFDVQYASNVRVPYLLTQYLLPMLTVARGQVVFINSSAGLSAKRADVGQYAATKHALKAVADSLREEVNPRGIRVMTLFLGRTATPMQARLYQSEGREYHPEMLLQPDDVASVIVHSLSLPRTAEVTDVSMRPMIKSGS